MDILCSIFDIQLEGSPPQPRYHRARHQVGSVLLHEVLRAGNRHEREVLLEPQHDRFRRELALHCEPYREALDLAFDRGEDTS